MLPIEYYLEARARADWHVQLELTAVAEEVETPGPALVRGKVIRVFRSTPALSLGDHLTFEVSVIRQSDDMPTGGTIWTDYERLKRVRFMEVFLNHENGPPHCEVALWQSRLLEAPSNDPFFD